MTRATFALAALLTLAAALPAYAAGPMPNQPDPVPHASLTPMGSPSDYAVLEIGSSAPDFAFESLAGGWNRLHDLREQGHVLLVIGADGEALVSLERERARLLALGVVPVAVIDARAGRCRALARRAGFEGTVVPDPRHVVSAQFNAHDVISGDDAPAWFVIDRSGCVRALGHARWPIAAWAQVVTGALGLPADDAHPAAYPAR